MADIDYAAGIDPKRRSLIFGQITRSLDLTIDWKSGIPGTPGFRRFFHSSHRPEPVEEHAIPEVLRPGPRNAAPEETRYRQVGSNIWNADLYEDPQPAPVPGAADNQSSPHGSPAGESSGECQDSVVSTQIYRPGAGIVDYAYTDAESDQQTHTNPPQQHNVHDTLHYRNASSPSPSTTGSSHSPVRIHPVSQTTQQSRLRYQTQQDIHNLDIVYELDAHPTPAPSPPITPLQGLSYYPLFSPSPSLAPHSIYPTQDRPPSHSTLPSPSTTPHPPPRSTRPSITSSLASYVHHDRGLLIYPPPLIDRGTSRLPLASPTDTVETFENPNLRQAQLTQREAKFKGLTNHLKWTWEDWVKKWKKLKEYLIEDWREDGRRGWEEQEELVAKWKRFRKRLGRFVMGSEDEFESVDNVSVTTSEGKTNSAREGERD